MSEKTANRILEFLRRHPSGQFLVYEAEDGNIKIDVPFEGDTAWLTEGMIAELFQTSQQNISQHVLNIYEDEELPPESTHKKFLLVRQEGAPHQTPLSASSERPPRPSPKSGSQGSGS